MTGFNDRLEERSYLLPKRIELTLRVVVAIAEEENISLTKLIEDTNHSRSYITACCQGLKRYGILGSKRGSKGGYWLVNGADKTTVGDVLEAISKAEDRGVISSAVYRFIIGKAKELTIKELMD